MGRLFLWSHKNYRLLLLGTFLFTALLIPTLSKVQINTSTDHLIAKNNPEKGFYRQAVRDFGADESAVVIIKDPEIFTPQKLELLNDLYYTFLEFDFVERVESVFSTKTPLSEDGTIHTSPPFEEIPSHHEEALKKVYSLKGNPIFDGNLLTTDHKGLVFHLKIVRDENAFDFSYRARDKIEEAIAPLQKQFQEIFQFGFPEVESEYYETIQKDQKVLLPIVILLISFSLFWGLKSPLAAITTILVGGVSIIWTIAIMVFLGIPLQLMTISLPTLLIAVGATEDTHIISSFLASLKRTKSPEKSIQEAGEKVGVAILLTTLTTVVGFFSIYFNEIQILKEFGLASSIALTVNFLHTTFGVPAILTLFCQSPKFIKSCLSTKEQKNTSFPQRLAFFNEENKVLVLCFSALLVVLGAIAYSQIAPDNSMLSMFKKESKVQNRHALVKENVNGTSSLYFVVDAPHADTFRKAENLKVIEDFQRFVEKETSFKATNSLSDLIRISHKEFSDEKKMAIPLQDELISQYLLLYSTDDLKNYSTTDYRRINIILKHSIYSSQKLRTQLQKVNLYAKSKLGSMGWDYRVSGKTYLIHSSSDEIVSGQIRSLLIVIGVALIMITLLFLNLKVTLISIVPNLLPIGLLFLYIWLFDMHFNIGVSIVAAISVGIALDDTIHFLTGYYSHYKTAHSPFDAIRRTIDEQFRPIVVTSLSLAAGFLTLTLSDFQPIRELGVLSAGVFISALFADLILTPALISLFPVRKTLHLFDIFKPSSIYRLIGKHVLLTGMSYWQTKRALALAKVVKLEAQEKVPLYQTGDENWVGLLVEGQLILKKTAQRKSEKEELIDVAKISHGVVFGRMENLLNNEGSLAVAGSDGATLLLWDEHALRGLRRTNSHMSELFCHNVKSIFSIPLT